MAKRLTAKRPILYGGRLRRAGEPLPVDNARLVRAWLEAGSAEWMDDAQPTRKPAETPAQKEIEREAADNAPEAPAGDMEAMTREQLAKLAAARGLKIPRGAKKAQIVAILQGQTEGGAHT